MINSIWRTWVAMALCLTALAAHADSVVPKPFIAGSMKQIVADRNIVAISGKLDPQRLECWIQVSIARNWPGSLVLSRAFII